jgi:hypothetical protein
MNIVGRSSPIPIPTHEAGRREEAYDDDEGRRYSANEFT